MTNKITYILLSFLLFVGCQQEELVVEQAKGYLVFGDVEIVSEINQEQTKAEDNISVLYSIKKIENSENSENSDNSDNGYVYKSVCDNVEYLEGKEEKLDPGLYLVEVYNSAYTSYNQWSSEDTGERIYYWNEEVSITSDEKNVLKIEVSMVNFGVSLDNNELLVELDNTFSEVNVIASIGRTITFDREETVFYSSPNIDKMTYSVGVLGATPTETRLLSCEAGKVYKISLSIGDVSTGN